MNLRGVRSREDPEINFIPLIDVLLVILIFLMVTTTYQRISELQITLPEADADATKDRPKEVNIGVDRDGRYVIDRTVFAFTTPAALAVKHATTTLPIVMTTAIDPVGAGLVASLARPGGTVTGNALLYAELSTKRLEFLKEVVPGLSRVGVLWNAANPANASVWRSTWTSAVAGHISAMLWNGVISTPRFSRYRWRYSSSAASPAAADSAPVRGGRGAKRYSARQPSWTACQGSPRVAITSSMPSRRRVATPIACANPSSVSTCSSSKRATASSTRASASIPKRATCGTPPWSPRPTGRRGGFSRCSSTPRA